MSTCQNCGVEFEGKFFSGGGLFTCPECFRLQQFSQKQAEAQLRSDESSRELLDAQLQGERRTAWEDGQSRTKAKIKTAITYLNAGMFDDAVRSVAEAAETADEEDTETRLDISAVYLCTAARTNKPRLAQQYSETFVDEVTDFLSEEYFLSTPVSEEFIEIPEHWKDALECLPNREATRDVAQAVRRSVAARVEAKHRERSAQERADSSSSQITGKSASAPGPVVRAAAVSAAHASVFVSRIWDGLKLGIGLGILSSLFFAGIYFFKGPMAGGVGLEELLVFGMAAGVVIGVVLKAKG